MTIQLDKICRTCMAESMTLTSIWSCDKSFLHSATNIDCSSDAPALALMLSSLMSSNVTVNDKLPNKMCLNCIREMNRAFAFKQKCERSEKTLLTLLDENTSKIECQSENIASVQHFKTKLDVENHSCKEKRKIGFTAVDHIDNTECNTKKTKPLIHKSKNIATEEAVMDFIAENTLKFVCIHCKANFSSRRSLNLHVNSRKCMQQTYECELCDKVFIKKRYLIRHLQRMHKIAEEKIGGADNKPNLGHRRKYNCNLCPKAFTMTSSLKDHLRIHTGERPYLCSICGKKFTQNSNLRQHLMRHNQNKPFECIKCAANFVSKGELVSHNRTHTGDHPFSCEICHFGFTTSSSLVKHRRIHSGERPYQCDLCPLRFTALGTMKNHRRTHTGEKYHCGVCNKSFSQKTDCVSHLRSHADN